MGVYWTIAESQRYELRGVPNKGILPTGSFSSVILSKPTASE